VSPASVTSTTNSNIRRSPFIHQRLASEHLPRSGLYLHLSRLRTRLMSRNVSQWVLNSTLISKNLFYKQGAVYACPVSDRRIHKSISWRRRWLQLSFLLHDCVNLRVVDVSLIVWHCGDFMFSLAPLDRFSCKICDKTIITRRWLRYVGYLPSQFRLSVVCNVRAHYSAGWDFRQHFHAILYISHRPTFVQNYTKIVPGEPLRRVLNARVVPKCI